MRRFVLAFDSFNDEGIEKFQFVFRILFFFEFFVLKSDFIIKRLIELSFVLLIFLNADTVANRSRAQTVLFVTLVQNIF